MCYALVDLLGRLSSYASRQSTSQVSGLHHVTVLEIAHALKSMAKNVNQLLSEGKVVPVTHGTRSMEGVGDREAQQHSAPLEQHHQVTQPTVGERLARQVHGGRIMHCRQMCLVDLPSAMWCKAVS